MDNQAFDADPEEKAPATYVAAVEAAEQAELVRWRMPDNDRGDAPYLERRLVLLEGGWLAANLHMIEEGLVEQQFGVFSNGAGEVMRVVEQTIEVVDGRHVVQLVLQPFDADGLVEPLGLAVRLWSKDGRSKKPKPINCPSNIARNFLRRQAHGLRLLTGVINAPTLRKDGSLLDKEGYDRKSGLLYVPQDGLDWPGIPDNPTREDALAALARLKEPLRHFPFVNLIDQTVALAMMMTACNRRNLPTAPAIIVVATEAGTGKTKLCFIACVLATGELPAGLTASDDRKEFEKRFEGKLLEGAAVIHVDNIGHGSVLDSQSFQQALTSEVAELRALGGSRIKRCLTKSLILGNGNGIEMQGNSRRRVLNCRLDAQMPNPESRKFDFDPVEMVKENRGQMIADVLTILRAHQLAGRPGWGGKPLGGFEEWCGTVRDPLMWLGEPDCALSTEFGVDGDRERMTGVIEHWKDLIGVNVPLSTAGVAKKADDSRYGMHSKPGLYDALSLVAAPGAQGSGIDNYRLGNYLARIKGRLTSDGLRIVRTEARASAEGTYQWVLEHKDSPYREPGRASVNDDHALTAEEGAALRELERQWPSIRE